MSVFLSNNINDTFETKITNKNVKQIVFKFKKKRLGKKDKWKNIVVLTFIKFFLDDCI